MNSTLDARNRLARATLCLQTVESSRNKGNSKAPCGPDRRFQSRLPAEFVAAPAPDPLENHDDQSFSRCDQRLGRCAPRTYTESRVASFVGAYAHVCDVGYTVHGHRF